jgi:hypothetical protein
MQIPQIPHFIPNVMVERLTLLVCIQQVPGSNLGLETSYPNRFFVGFLGPSK